MFLESHERMKNAAYPHSQKYETVQGANLVRAINNILIWNLPSKSRYFKTKNKKSNVFPHLWVRKDGF